MLLYNLSDLIMCSVNKIYYSAFVYYFMHYFYINMIQILTSILYTYTHLSLICVYSWCVPETRLGVIDFPTYITYMKVITMNLLLMV